MRLERDNFGRLYVRKNGREFYLTADGGLAVRWTVAAIGAGGKIWHQWRWRRLSDRLTAGGERIKAMLTMGME